MSTKANPFYENVASVRAISQPRQIDVAIDNLKVRVVPHPGPAGFFDSLIEVNGRELNVQAITIRCRAGELWTVDMEFTPDHMEPMPEKPS